MKRQKGQCLSMSGRRMLAICNEIADWREKKAAREANARYNEILNYGFDK